MLLLVIASEVLDSTFGLARTIFFKQSPEFVKKQYSSSEPFGCAQGKLRESRSKNIGS